MNISPLNIKAASMTYEQGKQVEKTRHFADVLKKEVANKHKVDNAKVQAEDDKIVAEDKKMRDACRGFEELFLEMMYKEMRSTVPENTLFGRSQGEKIWQSMLDSETMKEVAKTGGLGLADLIYQDLKLKETTQAK